MRVCAPRSEGRERRMTFVLAGIAIRLLAVIVAKVIFRYF
jgi:hypothetical protein